MVPPSESLSDGPWLSKIIAVRSCSGYLPERSGGRCVLARCARARSPRRGSAAPPRRAPGWRQGRCSTLPSRKQPSGRGNLPVSPHPFGRHRAPRFSQSEKRRSGADGPYARNARRPHRKRTSRPLRMRTPKGDEAGGPSPPAHPWRVGGRFVPNEGGPGARRATGRLRPERGHARVAAPDQAPRAAPTARPRPGRSSKSTRRFFWTGMRMAFLTCPRAVPSGRETATRRRARRGWPPPRREGRRGRRGGRRDR